MLIFQLSSDPTPLLLSTIKSRRCWMLWRWPWTDSTRCISYMLGNSNSRLILIFLESKNSTLSFFFQKFRRSLLIHSENRLYMENFDLYLGLNDMTARVHGLKICCSFIQMGARGTPSKTLSYWRGKAEEC